MSDNIENKKNTIYCSNCGKLGHLFKICKDPVTSHGIVLVKINDGEYEITNKLIKDYDNYNYIQIRNEGINYNNSLDLKTFCYFKDRIKFMLIRRKHTLGFLEFIRGRYNIENVDGIIFLFKQMTNNEILSIGTNSFDELWKSVWKNNKSKLLHTMEYNNSKEKFNKLKIFNENYLNLDFYVEHVKPNYSHPEWGFPKGRRNIYETDLECAKREFEEETGFNFNEYVLLDKIKPIDEKFIGTNGVSYKHKYYFAVTNTNRKPVIDSNNPLQYDEIGDIGWFTYDEAIRLIRPHHTERKKLLTEIYMHIINNVIKILR